MDSVRIIECPRDAWQGLPQVIPTSEKVAYLRRLIEAGFRHIDAVSFVAPKYVPQTADSEAVLKELEREAAKEGGGKRTANLDSVEIIGIVVNEQGLERALQAPRVTTLGYPYSVSAHFRRQNTNMSLSETRALVEKLAGATSKAKRGLAIYISMAFGNPYGEPWGVEIVAGTLDWLKRTGVKSVSLADTAGVARAEEIGSLLRAVREYASEMELGVHLHSRLEDSAEKVLAAYEAGCRRFDCALTGLGGCPFAGDYLVGNIPTETVISTLAARGAECGPDPKIEPWALLSLLDATREIRAKYGHD